MEVHAPHEPILTFKEFIVHLLVVTVGILIALGLEQSVEALHHRHLAQEARDNMLSEIRDNKRELDQSLARFEELKKQRSDDVAIVNQLLAHKKLTDMSLALSFSGPQLNTASWSTASTIGALSFMDYAEVKRFSEVYRLQGLYDRLLNEQIEIVQTGLGLLNILGDGPEKVSDEELRSIKHQLLLGSASLMVMQQTGQQLDSMYAKILGK